MISESLKEQVKVQLEKSALLQPVKEKYRNPKSLSERFEAIREAYSVMGVDKAKGADPYILDWALYETPIEQLVWSDTRGCGFDFLREYPVLNYFIDFANPENKLGIEADGEAWHSREKDLKRDTRLRAIGWRIYRISGRLASTPGFDELREQYPDCWSKDEKAAFYERYYTETSEGIIRLIATREIENRIIEGTDRFSINQYRLI